MKSSTAGISILLVALGVWQLYDIWHAAIALGLMDWITDVINGILFTRQAEAAAKASFRRESVNG